MSLSIRMLDKLGLLAYHRSFTNPGHQGDAVDPQRGKRGQPVDRHEGQVLTSSVTTMKNAMKAKSPITTPRIRRSAETAPPLIIGKSRHYTGEDGKRREQPAPAGSQTLRTAGDQHHQGGRRKDAQGEIPPGRRGPFCCGRGVLRNE